jgi:hypothetical protein
LRVQPVWTTGPLGAGVLQRTGTATSKRGAR